MAKKKVAKKTSPVKSSQEKTVKSTDTGKSSKKIESVKKPVKASISLTLNQATLLQTTLGKKGRKRRFLDRKITQAEIDAKAN